MGIIGRGIDKFRRKFQPEKMQRQLVDTAVSYIKNYPETQFLLQLAEQEGIGFAFDPDLKGTQEAGALTMDRKTGQQYIALNPDADPVGLAFTLIHELRHVWQNKVLGLTPQSLALSEPDIETKMLFTRVREADAHAFTNLMIRRMQADQQDKAEVQQLIAQHTKLSGAPPDEFQLKLFQQYLTEKFIGRFESDAKQMVLDFAWTLENLDRYDRSALLEYHARYTSPNYDQQPHANPDSAIGLKDIRRMLKLGVGDSAPSYLQNVQDADFKTAIMHDVQAPLKEAANLMATFEKAAKRGLPPADNGQYRIEIEDKLARALKAPAPQITKSRFDA